MIRKFIIAIFLLSASASGFAQETRAALIHQIVEAQGVQDAFADQISQQREGMEQYATQMYSQIVSGFGGKESDKTRAVFTKYMKSISDLISVSEMTSKWEAGYGEGLTDADLVKILAYYNSDVGKKDIASAKASAKQFTSWMLSAYQKRSEALLNSFVSDLKACF